MPVEEEFGSSPHEKNMGEHGIRNRLNGDLNLKKAIDGDNTVKEKDPFSEAGFL